MNGINSLLLQGAGPLAAQFATLSGQLQAAIDELDRQLAREPRQPELPFDAAEPINVYWNS